MNLHLHLGGKVGELVYASGTFPAIRTRWPGAHLVLHLHPHYLDVAAGLRHQPDDLSAYTIPDVTRPLAAQVTDCLRVAHRANRGRPLAWRPDGDGHVLMYGLHQAEAAKPAVERRPFYALFQAAADAGAGQYKRPSWGTPCVLPPDSVLVFASGNQHTGGARQIDLSETEWCGLAVELESHGLEALATGHPEDPRPCMPGWRWLNHGPAMVLAHLRTCAAALGLNSGITFAACQIAPGTVTMLDTQGRPEYFFGPMYADRVLDPTRHFQVPWAEAAGDMFGTVRRALGLR